jgi:FMN phosphatase YigB (HAD superfamily)
MSYNLPKSIYFVHLIDYNTENAERNNGYDELLDMAIKNFPRAMEALDETKKEKGIINNEEEEEKEEGEI